MIDYTRLRDLDQSIKPARHSHWRIYLSAAFFGLLVGILSYVLLPSMMKLETTSTPTPTSTAVALSDSVEPTSTLQPTDTPAPIATPELVQTPLQAGCQSWDTLTLNDVDKKLCVQGVYLRYYQRKDGTNVMLFSEETGTFQLWTVGKPFEWYLRGVVDQCVRATGWIMTTGVRPIMVLGRGGQLEPCK